MDILNELDKVIDGELKYSEFEIADLIERAKSAAKASQASGASVFFGEVERKLPILSAVKASEQVEPIKTGGYNVGEVAKRLFGGSGE